MSGYTPEEQEVLQEQMIAINNARGEQMKQKTLFVRYFREMGHGAVHSVQVDDEGRPVSDHGALCGATCAVLTEPAGRMTLLHEVLPYSLMGKPRCRKCAYAQQALRLSKDWEATT